MRILLSRTDSIGDVVLTLPMAGFIKQYIPEAELHFLGRSYTKSVISCSEHIDSFLNWDDINAMPEKEASSFLGEKNYDVCIHVFPEKKISRIVKSAGISLRIGTSGRFYNWIYCNKVVRFTRRRSEYWIFSLLAK